MPGPLVHRASAKQMAKMLKGVLRVRVTPAAYMLPDIERRRRPGSHPGYDAIAMNGTLVDAVMGSVVKMRLLLAERKHEAAGELAQSVQHLVCDAHMVTQVVPSLHEHDGMMDALAELVFNKDGACHGAMPDTAQDFAAELRRSIARTAALYAAACRKSRGGFVLKHLGPMTRRCVERGAYFGTWFVRLALGGTE